MEHAAVDHVTGETELPRPVAVFEVTPVEDVVRLWQTDLVDGRHPIERAGPERAIAAGIIRIGFARRGPAARPGEDQRLVLGLAGPRRDPAHQEADLRSCRGRQTLEKGEQVYERAGLRNAVGVLDPDPVEFVL